MVIDNASNVELCRLFPSSFRGTTLCWLTSLTSQSISGFQDLGHKFCNYFAAQREIIPTSDHLLTVQQHQFESVRAYTERFNKEAIKVPNLNDQEHIKAYKHGLQSLSLTKVLATKHYLPLITYSTQFMNSSKERSASRENEHNMITCRLKEKAKNFIVCRTIFDNPSANDCLTRIIGTHREVVPISQIANSTHIHLLKSHA